jgi:hypothetical protein
MCRTYGAGRNQSGLRAVGSNHNGASEDSKDSSDLHFDLRVVDS